MLRKSWKLLVPDLVCSSDGDRMRLHGIASSTVVDRHGDEITEKALRSMERQAVGQNIFLNHSWVMPEDLAGTVTAAQVQKASDGVWELHYDVDINAVNQRAVDTWKAINNGTKLGISIEAMVPPNSAKRGSNGGIVIDDIELMGASFVAHPANTRAWTDYVVKSLTGYLPDKLRVMETTQGRDFYMKAAARANAEAIARANMEEEIEDNADDDAEPVAATESQVDAPEVIASADPVVTDPAPEVTDSAGTHPHAHAHDHEHSHGYEGETETIHSHSHAHQHSHEHDEGHAHDDLMDGYEHSHYHNGSYDTEHAHDTSGETTKDAAPDVAPVTLDVTDATTVIQHPDGTTVWVESEDADAASKAASQDTSDTSPDTGSGEDEAEVLDDNGLDNEAILGDDVTKAMTAYGPTISGALDGQMTLIASLTDQVIGLKTALVTANAERTAALELARDTIKDSNDLVLRLLDSPMGRRTVVKEATEGMAHLRDVYGDQIVKLLSQS